MVIKINRRPSSEKGTTNNKEGFFMDKKDTTFAVIGCGQFGGSVVEELARQGADVLAIDCNEEVIKKIVLTLASQASYSLRLKQMGEAS